MRTWVRWPLRAGRRTNLAVLVVLTVAFLSGWAAFAAGTPTAARLIAVLHAIAGLGLVVLVPWKAVVVGRATRKHLASALLAALIALSVLAGIVHTLLGFNRYAGLTAMQVHVGAALFALPVVVWHVLRHRQRPARTDASRRALLRTAGLGVAAAAAYLLVEGIAVAARLPGATRRATGSHAVDRPVVTLWLFDSVPDIDVESWRLRSGSRVWRYAELTERAGDEVDAVLDCTNGWYAETSWRGIALDRVLGDLPAGARSIRVHSQTGYDRYFPLDDTPNLLLATHLGGAPLTAGHGAPLRLVAPGRRGFWWVKWVDLVEFSDRLWWAQPPFPTQ